MITLSRITIKRNKIKLNIKDDIKPKKIKGDPSSIGKSELQIEKEICNYLSSMNIQFWQIKIKGEPHAVRGEIIRKISKNKGFSDILCCVKGLMICLEVKKCGGYQTANQQEFEMKVKTQGGIYFIATSVTEVMQMFKSLNLIT